MVVVLEVRAMTAYRSEIDGLRALAVLSVLLFHCGFGGFSGGFVGVDVFFVISGYLITKNISQQMNAETFSFRSFYLARLKRLFPALLTTVVATLAFGSLLFSPIHLAKLAQSAIWSIVGMSNFYFWGQAGYWDLESSLKPLLHIWSLSVEEQFYLLWPLLLLLASRLSKGAAITLLTISGIASSFSADFFRSSDPSGVFYLMPFRAFEFAIGASVILLEENFPQRSPWLEVSAIGGLMLIGWAVFIFTEATKFPIYGAVYPCVGTALLIHAGRYPLVSRLWNNRPAIWTGRISYSLYLVHWPIIIFYQYWRNEPLALGERYGLVVASFATALPLHYWVERRYRYAGGDWQFLAKISAIACIAVAASFSAWQSDGWRWRLSTPQIAGLPPLCKDGSGLCPGGRDVALIGDSHATAIAHAAAAALQQAGKSGSLYETYGNCALMFDAFAVQVLDEISGSPCLRGQISWRTRISAENPKVVILSSFWISGLDGANGRLVSASSTSMPTPDESREVFKARMTETIDWLTAQGRKVAIIGTSPLVDTPPPNCYERPDLFSKAGCANNRISGPETHAFADAFLRSLAANRTDVLYISLTDLLCSNGTCPLGEHGASFYYDRHHLSALGEAWVFEHGFGELIRFLRGPLAWNMGDPPSKLSGAEIR
jgi:peptidoglycan/LPS O-acetylase OafA/YrhL